MQLFHSVKPFRYHAVLMIPDTFGFLDKALINLRWHFGCSLNTISASLLREK